MCPVLTHVKQRSLDEAIANGGYDSVLGNIGGQQCHVITEASGAEGIGHYSRAE